MEQARCIRRVNWQIKCKAETFEIFFQMVVCRISAFEIAMCSELLKDQQPERWPHLGDDDLSGFGIEIAAEALEVSTKQHSVTAQVFVDQVSIGGHCRNTGSALKVNLLEARHPVILPVQ